MTFWADYGSFMTVQVRSETENMNDKKDEFYKESLKYDGESKESPNLSL